MNALLRLTYARYLLASAGALAVDLATFLLLLAALPAGLAAGAGYCAGIAAHWLLSSRVVFADRIAACGSARTQQQLLFVLSALAGLALTVGIVGLGATWGLQPLVAKVAAVAISFQATYALRRWIVFA